MHKTDFLYALEANCIQINSILENYLNSLSNQHNTLIQAMRYSTLLGGKRLRPFLVYQIGQLFGLQPSSLHVAAAAIEFVHTYSLIHDDLPAMDNDLLRRGYPTCHIKYGENIAILAGNALQTLAFSILSNEEMPGVTIQSRLQIITTIANAIGANGMCFGQALDLTSGGIKIPISKLKIIYRYKTSLLIQAAVRIGAIAAGVRSTNILTMLDCYASSIGLSFQIRDDILNVIGNSKKTGKQQGTDYMLNKNTYPSLLCLNKAQDKAYNLYCESLIALKYIKSLGYDTNILVALAQYIIERDK